MAEFEEKYTPQSVADALMDMQDVTDKFFDACDNIVTRMKIQHDIDNWFCVQNNLQCTAEEFKRSAWNAMRAIVMGGE